MTESCNMTCCVDERELEMDEMRYGDEDEGLRREPMSSECELSDLDEGVTVGRDGLLAMIASRGDDDEDGYGQDGDLGGLVRSYMPILRGLARRYEGRGAEREDLEQEGSLALVRMARLLSRDEFRRRVLWGLRSHVRDAAESWSHRGRPGRASVRGDHEDLSIDAPLPGDGDACLCDMIECSDARAQVERIELRASVDRALDEGERRVLDAAERGLTLVEIARAEAIPLSTLRARVSVMRKKVAGSDIEW